MIETLRMRQGSDDRFSGLVRGTLCFFSLSNIALQRHFQRRIYTSTTVPFCDIWSPLSGILRTYNSRLSLSSLGPSHHHGVTVSC